jgi:hypothetical protein
MLHAGSLLGFHFIREDRGDLFLQGIILLSADYMALFHRELGTLKA